VTERRGRRGKKLLDDLEEKRVCMKLKEETVDRTLWRTDFGRDCTRRHIMRQTAE
jgi:hypothetical protein